MSWNLARKELLDIDDLQAMLEESPAQAAEAILAAASQGNVEAHALLGQILLDGRGIQRDQALAMTWFRIAATQGHSMARNMLGRCFEHGWGCAPDPMQAALHYRRAAEQGLDWGLYNLGNLLATGRGVEQDHRQAVDCYRKAADQGHAKSMNLLGRYLEEGVTGQRDVSAAHECYRRSAEGGDFRGQFSHATVLAEQGHIEQALGWLKKALTEGNLNFLRVGRKVLLDAVHPDIRRMSADYFKRAAAIGDESDRMALREFSARPA
ncbi:tetratricopeptide repeat protein [Pseudomonas alliivorans]|uniref:tetratricopeptide repeat protein n=1 Tax=Pseudomonas alliivorans TaxID=2810613 RepID=UPI001612F00D|nr:tetratricopeptide repeat protein [Pseudomonas alliivorans]MCO5367351.1 sel1 repeat family protein [Pseudomonas alliivorans]MEE4342286.1 tetratricopeptide repeat protein [Pseudomonas alliivorans]MEE5125806.1 tetratricopeptide repeat protein [Pseudomonas alliivorans]MEE5164016.1 tetratricopeptide repeat protein [Pseudomonas alliivorans]